MDVTAEREADGMLAVNVDGHRLRAPVILDGDAILVMVDGRTRKLLRHDPAAAAAAQDAGGGKLTSPMPGKIVRVLEIGRPSCRERVCPSGEISVVAVILKKKKKT